VRIVLETNVLIAALLSPQGAPAQLLDLALAEEITMLVDDRILADYREIAQRQKFGFREADLSKVFETVAALGEHVSASPLAVTLPDNADLPFAEVAITGLADALVTRSALHFIPKRGTPSMHICSPDELLNVLRR
jgi:putative PIN family toxin of toxin-antitoxin system